MNGLNLHVDAGGVAVLTIDQPGRSMNVIDWALARALDEMVTRIAADDAIRALIVTSGKRSFIAGADLAIMKDFVAPGVTAPEAARMIGRVGQALRRLETLGKPVVGASPGTALGGGLELLLACHWRVAADDPQAQYGLPEVTLGLLPGAGGTQRVPRLIGLAKALPLLVQGRPLSTAAAKDLGLIDEVVPAERLLDAAREAIAAGRVRPEAPWDRKGFALPGGDSSQIAHSELFTAHSAMARGADGGQLMAPTAILSCVYEGSRLPIDRALWIEQQYFATLVQSAQAQALIRTRFFARQAADRLARRPAGVDRRRFTRIGVLGSGFMGRGVAQVAARAGISVALVDRDLATAQAAREALLAQWQDDVAKNRLTADKAAQLASRVQATEISGLADCELVVEAAPEDLSLKRDLLAALGRVLPASAIVASNTSTLPIGELAAACPVPAQVVGLHFFSPVPRMALVEVIRGPATGDATLAHALDLVRQIGKTPIVVGDGFGFYTTLCVEAFVREGLRLLIEGQGYAAIENAAIALGMPVGPLALADEVGLDVLHHVQHEAVRRGLDRADASHALIDRLVQAGRLGRKAGAGLYEHGARRQPWPELALAAQAEPLPAAELQERLLLAQVLAAARAWDRAVIADAGDADVGAALGWAFPAALGGPFSVIDQAGAAAFVQRCEALAARCGPRFDAPPCVREAAQHARQFHPAV